MVLSITVISTGRQAAGHVAPSSGQSHHSVESLTITPPPGNYCYNTLYITGTSTALLKVTE